MDNDLSRSLRLLDEATFVSSKKILKKSLHDLKKQDISCSFTLAGDEIDAFLNEDTSSLYNQTFNNVLQKNTTLTGSVITAHEPWKNTADSLHLEFFEILQTYSENNDALGLVAEMSKCCSDALNVIKGLKSKIVVTSKDEEAWLETERNTWRLLYVLYGNRLSTSGFDDDQYGVYFGGSEKFCTLSLFKRESLVRESQLVLDWLECNAAQKDDIVLHFSDNTIGWENTLHQLNNKDTIVFEASRKIVSAMDPDAPIYEELPLHDLDMEDDKRLCQKMFLEIRCGKLADAQKLCNHCGHPWRAAQLEGWKLYHNPNLIDPFEKEFEEDVDIQGGGETQKYKPIEGNEYRDLWKLTAWEYSNAKCLNKYERAAVAAYCGNLDALLNVASNWEDYLWAHLKVMIDIKVESEIRENVLKTYEAMPDDYWNQKMSVNEVFDRLEASKDKHIQVEALTPEHLIQKYIILDEINKLLELMIDWIMESSISNQFLRFLSHLVLFLEQIGQLNNREVLERVIEEYLKRLVDMRHTQLITFYVSKLNEAMQIHIYSAYLETIIDNSERKESLTFAENCGLNIHSITKQIVENIRSKHDPDFDGDLQKKISQFDEFKISSLDWLLFYEAQLPDALEQANAIMFQFLMLKKLDAAQLAFNKLPVDIIQKLQAEGETSERIQQHIRDYLSYKAYLDAQEAFNNWFDHFQSKPHPPLALPENAPFTEKVAHEHKVSQYKAEIGRWKLTIGQLVKLAKTTLYNVLLFPDGGWLHGAQDAYYLQSNCIPECTLLLYSVLYNSELYEECVQLADIIASKEYNLYKVYPSEKLGELFRKLSEASVALLNEKKDPWGNEMSA